MNSTLIWRCERIECPYRQYDNKEHIQWTMDNLKEGIK